MTTVVLEVDLLQLSTLCERLHFWTTVCGEISKKDSQDKFGTDIPGVGLRS